MRLFLLLITAVTFLSTITRAQTIVGNFKPIIKDIPFVQTTYLLEDGKVLMAGDFNLADNTRINPIVRLNSDGSIDSTFNAPAFDRDNVRNVIMNTNGKIIVMEWKDMSSYTFLNEDGSIVQDFKLLSNPEYVYNFWPEDTTFLAQRFKDSFGFFLTRINEDGSIASNFQEPYFNSDGTVSIQEIVHLSGGQILVIGNFTEVNQQPYNRIVLLNSDGTIETSFNPGLGFEEDFDYVDAEIQFDKILISGSISKYNGIDFPKGLIRINLDGTMDEAFVMGPVSNLFYLDVITQTVDYQGRIIIAGSILNDGFSYKIYRLMADGSIDASFFPLTLEGRSYGALDIFINSNNEIVLGSDVRRINGKIFTGYAVVDETGQLKNDINTKLWRPGKVTDAVKQPDGKIIVIGEFLAINQTSTNYIARINSDGTLDNTFNSTLDFKNNDNIQSIALQKDGKILLGGYFKNLRNYSDLLLRLNVDGSLDDTFNTEIPAQNVGVGVTDIEILENERMVICGFFSYVNNQNRNRLARLHPNGSLDLEFNKNNSITEDFRIKAMDVFESTGEILLGGEIVSPSWTSKGKTIMVDSLGQIIPKFNTDNTFSTSFNDIVAIDSTRFICGGYPLIGYTPGNIITPIFIADKYGNEIDSLSISALNDDNSANIFTFCQIDSARVLIGGYFTELNGFQNSGISKVNLNGGVDFHFNFNVMGGIEKILKYDENHVLIFGKFSEINENPYYSAAKVKIKNYLPVLPKEIEIIVNEDSVMNFDASELSIYDEDDSLSEISITYLPGENYQVENNKVVPNANYSGDLTVNARISDEKVVVDVAFKVIILPINDAPKILSVLAVNTIAYDSPLTITSNMFEIDDPDNDLSEISVFPKDGANYWLEENVVHVPDWYRGEITVYVVASDGIEESSPFTFNVRVATVTNLEDRIANSINVFPNPVTNGILNIHNDTQNKLIQHIRLCDLSGKTILSENKQNITPGSNYAIDLVSIKPGIYILSLESTDSSITKKIKIEK